MRTSKPLIYTLNFAEIGLKDIARVGGKNASLGELFNSLRPKGVGVQQQMRIAPCWPKVNWNTSSVRCFRTSITKM